MIFRLASLVLLDLNPLVLRFWLTFKNLSKGDYGLLGPGWGGCVLASSGALALLGVIGAVDWVITSDISVSVFYVLPVSLAVWTLGPGAGIVMSISAASVWYAAEYYGRGGIDQTNTFWQCLSRLCFYLLIAWLVNRIRLLRLNLEALVKARTAALEAEVLRRQQLEREAVEIAESEQERVGAELHDELAAYLSGIAFRGKLLAESLHRHAAPESADAANLVTLVNCATDKVCNFARMLTRTESDDDLAAALSQLGSEAETVFGITCVVEVRDLPRVTKEQCGQLYRIAREAIRNAIQHSRSDLVQITVNQQGKALQLSVICDGKLWELSHQSPRGLGLRIMRQRSERLGGRLSIQPRPSGGAIVICEVPTDGPPDLVASSVLK